MKTYFGTDQKRIDHALSVLGYATRIQLAEGGDEKIVFAAAVLHDIGIPECERKYGSIAGPHQEKEGPPIARDILEKVGMDEERTEHVCDIIADHHSAKRMDTLEFRILWDADWLVNIPNWHADAGREELEELIGKVFKTGAGREIALASFLEERKG
jgi:HD superfamily phosphodiesterase